MAPLGGCPAFASIKFSSNPLTPHRSAPLQSPVFRRRRTIVGEQRWFCRDDDEWSAFAERHKLVPGPHCRVVATKFLTSDYDSRPAPWSHGCV